MKSNVKLKINSKLKKYFVAESEGFEPTIPF